MIGVLIETNDRIIAAIENYDLVSRAETSLDAAITHKLAQLTKPDTSEAQVKEIQEGLAAAKISTGELGKLQDKQRAAIHRSIGRSSTSDMSPGSGDESPTSPSSPTYVHPDLQDLQFGALGSEQRYISFDGVQYPSDFTQRRRHRGLPPPIRPTSARRSSSEDDDAYRRGSLSDYSDYQSSDEETHHRAGPSSGAQPRRGYVDVSDDESSHDVRRDPKQSLLHANDDPFADPFAD